jgi:hypothetical protein
MFAKIIKYLMKYIRYCLPVHLFCPGFDSTIKQIEAIASKTSLSAGNVLLLGGGAGIANVATSKAAEYLASTLTKPYFDPRNIAEFPPIYNYPIYGESTTNSLKTAIRRLLADINDPNQKSIKGLLLMGEPGCGKTLLLDSLLYIIRQNAVDPSQIFFTDTSYLMAGDNLTQNLLSIQERLDDDPLAVLIIWADDQDDMFNSSAKIEKKKEWEDLRGFIKRNTGNQQTSRRIIVVGGTNQSKEDLEPALFRRFHVIDMPFPEENDRKMHILYYCGKGTNFESMVNPIHKLAVLLAQKCKMTTSVLIEVLDDAKNFQPTKDKSHEDNAGPDGVKDDRPGMTPERKSFEEFTRAIYDKTAKDPIYNIDNQLRPKMRKELIESFTKIARSIGYALEDCKIFLRINRRHFQFSEEDLIEFDTLMDQIYGLQDYFTPQDTEFFREIDDAIINGFKSEFEKFVDSLDN